MKNFCLLIIVAVVCTLPAFADDDHHHEALTPDQLGSVHFPVSCAAAEQKPFERGVALLHSFWYEEAQKEFEQIAKDDPQCAMAHWGIAMSIWHQLWNHPDAAVVAHGEAEVKAARALKAKTQRERDYIAAMGAFYGGSDTLDYQARADAYSHAMAGVYKNYPDDLEAAAFYALSLLASEPDNDTTFANRKQAAAILEKLFAVEPDHPGVAHYLIHSYDKPQLAALGLPAARRYAQIAPAAPHALHMPSHIFARLGLWQDDINSNLASVAATRKTAAMHMGGEGHQFHAMDFLMYAYLQSGKDAEAQALIAEVKAMPEMHDMYGLGFDPHLASLSLFPAEYALEHHDWKGASALVPVEGAAPGDHAITYWARAIGSAHQGDLAAAHKDVDEMDAMRAMLAQKNQKFSAEAIAHDRQQAMAWISYAEKRDDEALRSLRQLAETEEAQGDEPYGGIPSRELLADMLVEMNRPEQALVEYKMDLKFNPNRFDGLYGAAHASEMAGKNDEANEYYAQLVKVCQGADSDRPELNRAKELLAKK
jgi:tetratricopeptide (TPR) repeat protein